MNDTKIILPPKKFQHNITERKEQHIHEIQIVNDLYLDNTSLNDTSTRIYKLIHNKIKSYIQQDIKKERFENDKIVTLPYVIEKLVESQLRCCYCKSKICIQFTETRQMDQWTLDRINNCIGHNISNVLISCLKCNLQRRRIKKDHFLFTKQLFITKLE